VYILAFAKKNKLLAIETAVNERVISVKRDRKSVLFTCLSGFKRQKEMQIMALRDTAFKQ
jgi:hypothetical protein